MELLTLAIPNQKVILPGIRTKIKLKSGSNDSQILSHFLLGQEGKRRVAEVGSGSGTSRNDPRLNNRQTVQERANESSSTATLVSLSESIGSRFILLLPLKPDSDADSGDLAIGDSSSKQGNSLIKKDSRSSDIDSDRAPTPRLHKSPFYGGGIGCVCRIIRMVEAGKAGGDFIVDLEGLYRARVESITSKTIVIPTKISPLLDSPMRKTRPASSLGYFVANAAILDSSLYASSSPDTRTTMAAFIKSSLELTQALTSLLHPQIIKPLSRLLQDAQSASMSNQSDGSEAMSRLVDLLAFLVDCSWEEGVEVLGAVDLGERVVLVGKLVDRQVKVLQVTKDIDSIVQQKLSDKQREVVLREKLEAIKKELGELDGSETEDSDLDVLGKKLKALALPPSHAKLVLRDFARLKRTNASMTEHQLLRTYLEWIIELPWGKYSLDRLDIAYAQKVLDNDHHGMTQIKKRIIQYLSVRKLKKDTKSPIICFLGPPGVGKTSLGKSIATSLDRKFYRMSLGGVRDEAEIRGHRRTYVGAMPGIIVQALKRSGVANPLILLDEVDKMGRDGYRGDPAAALLEVLDPEQNSTFTDHYLNLEFDLSQVLFIATANDIESIPEPLLDRMEIIRLNGYSIKEKQEISKKHLLPKQIATNGLPPNSIQLSDELIERIVVGYTREPGVRGLERDLGAICRYYAHHHSKNLDKDATHQFEAVAVGVDMLEEILGHAVFEEEMVGEDGEVGLVNGMAYSSSGLGSLLQIETRSAPAGSSFSSPSTTGSMSTSSGRLVLTGKLGDVIKESAQVAHSWVMCHIPSAPTILYNRNIHIHFPAGATPKDGPSAGVTIVTAMVSLLLNKAVPSTIAMTGEITLRGAVLPVGGIKEKVMAAYRAGVKKVLIPKRNIRDWEQVENREELVSSHFKVVGCDRIEMVLQECGLFGDVPSSAGIEKVGNSNQASARL